jgi:predicted O-methyltransferase YrrM
MRKTIELYEEPIDIFKKIGERHSELSDLELSFICGIIRQYKPKHIVEVGVSGGGTTSVILNCIDKLEMDSKVVSVDLAYTYHKNTSRECGFQIKDAAKYLKNVNKHQLFLGKRISEVIDDIVIQNGKIDLLILDTIHFLPGELLDFLVCYPYLSDNAIVVLDDLLWAHGAENISGIATRVLYDSVVADKFSPVDFSKANMAAFQINVDTGKYINDSFLALFTPWHYQMHDEMIGYRRIISKFYDDEVLKIFDDAVEKNNSTLQRKEKIPDEIKNYLR